MGFSLGIVGLPNVGKSTVFNALTAMGVDASNYPFCTIEKNVGMVSVSDPRLAILNTILQPAECISATIEFIDIAGLVKNASKNEGLGNKFLGHIREVDAILHLVRCFDDENVVHVHDTIDPVADAEVVTTELMLADLEQIEGLLDKTGRMLKSGQKEFKVRFGLLEKLKEALDTGHPVSSITLSEEEQGYVLEYGFLTSKPVLYVANVSEDALVTENTYTAALRQAFGTDKVVTICAGLEAEVATLDPADAEEYLQELGVTQSGLERLIQAGYDLLGLITYYTVANNKMRAWRLHKGLTAPVAAGQIHSDMERGFIRAEIAAFKDLQQLGSMAALREKGHLRTEGRDYPIADGDVVKFLFNV